MPTIQTDTLPVGTVVRIPERKTTIYKITEACGDRCRYVLRRCLNQRGHPLAGDRTSYLYDFANTSRMTVICRPTEGEPVSETAPAPAHRSVPLSALTDRFVPDCIVSTYDM